MGSGLHVSSVLLPVPSHVILPVTCKVGTITPPHSWGSSCCSPHPTHLMQAKSPCRRVTQVSRVFRWLPHLRTSEISPPKWGFEPAICPPPFPSKSSTVGDCMRKMTHTCPLCSILWPLLAVSYSLSLGETAGVGEGSSCLKQQTPSLYLRLTVAK